jgi:hypothetical protein
MAETTNAAPSTETQAAPRANGDTAPAEKWEGIDIGDEEAEEAGSATEQVTEPEGPPETPKGTGRPQATPPPETPSEFNPAEYGLDESYRACKTPAEAIRLAEHRRREAETKIAEQGKELGELRKAKPAPEPEKPPEAPAKAEPWKPEDVDRFHEEFIARPDAVVNWIVQQAQAPLVPLVQAVQAEVKKLAESNEALKSENARMRDEFHQAASAPAVKAASEEMDKFYADTPEAVPYRESGKLSAMYARLNEGRPPENALPVRPAEIFSLVQLEETDPQVFGEVFDLCATGKVRFEKALRVAREGREEPGLTGLRGRTEVRTKAAAGKGSSGPPQTETGIDIGEEED